MEKRTCKYCFEDKSIDQFEVANIVKGKVYRRWRCKKCQTDSKRARKQEIKQWYDDLKKTFKCKKCGEDKFYMLDLHHRDPSEKEYALGVALGRGWSKAKILKEIAKCDVLCSNHHRELHYNEKNKQVECEKVIANF